LYLQTGYLFANAQQLQRADYKYFTFAYECIKIIALLTTNISTINLKLAWNSQLLTMNNLPCLVGCVNYPVGNAKNKTGESRLPAKPDIIEPVFKPFSCAGLKAVKVRS